MLGANLTTQVLKALAATGRTWSTTAPPRPGAFPSGHVTVAMSLAMALVLVAPPAAALDWPPLAGCAYASLVGVAVIALDWHRPSEVVSGYLVSVGWAAAVAAVIVAAWGTDELGGGGPSPARRAGAVAAIVVGAVFVLVVGVTAVRRLDVFEFVDDRTAFAAAAAAAVAACAAPRRPR